MEFKLCRRTNLFMVFLYGLLLTKPALSLFSLPSSLADQIDVNSSHTVDGTVDVNAHLDQDMMTQLEHANANWDNTNQAINGVGEQWGRTNNVLETLTDPINLGLLAASAASGMVLGSAAAHLAIEIVKFNVKKLYAFLHEAITHEKANQKLIEDFVEANEHYEKTLIAAQHVEKVLTSLVKLRGELTEAKVEPTRESANSALNSLISHLSFKAKTMKEEKERCFAQGDVDGYVQRDVARTEAESHKGRLKDLRESIGKSSQRDMCDLIHSLYYGLILQEDKLQEYRTNMRVAEKEWLKRFREYKETQNERTLKIYKDAPKIYHASVKNLKSMVKNHVKEIKRDRTRSIKGCMLVLKEKGLSKAQLRKNLAHEQRQLGTFKADRLVWRTDGEPQAGYRRFFSLTSVYRKELCETRYEISVLARHENLLSLKRYYRREAHRARKTKARIKEMHLKSLCTVVDNPALLRQHPEQSADAIEAHLILKFDRIVQDSIDYNRSAWGNPKALDFSREGETDRLPAALVPRITQARALRPKIEELCGF